MSMEHSIWIPKERLQFQIVYYETKLRLSEHNCAEFPITATYRYLYLLHTGCLFEALMIKLSKTFTHDWCLDSNLQTLDLGSNALDPRA